MENIGNNIFSGSRGTSNSSIPFNHYVKEVTGLDTSNWNAISGIDNKGANVIFEADFKYVESNNRFFRHKIINIQ